MITYHEGDILKSGANIICHQVNCRGVMGAGLAKQIKNKYPVVFKKYRELCEFYNPYDLLGSVSTVLVDARNRVWIANLFAQLNYGKSKLQYTNYDALRKCFLDLKNQEPGMTIAIPYGIGCGLGGGDWNVVKKIIESVFTDSDHDVQIWRLNK